MRRIILISGYLLFVLPILLMQAHAQEKAGISIKFLFSFGSEGSAPGQLKDPQAISANPEGNIYIADTGNNRFQKFDKKGNFIREVGGFGWEKEQFHRPLDICAKSGLDVFVADYNNQRIERYDRNLNYISSLYSAETLSENLRFGFPSGVNISQHGDLFIIDNENNRVLKVSSFGKAEISFGDFAWGQGKLDKPTQVEISKENIVFVSDEAGNRIVVFDYYGNYLTEFGRGILKAPKGLHWDGSGRLWVADCGNHRIIAFDPQGSVLLDWGKQGEKIGAFNYPADVVVHDHRIYVLDSGNNRVQVFTSFVEK